MYGIIVLRLSDSKQRAEGWDPITDRSKQALKKQSNQKGRAAGARSPWQTRVAHAEPTVKTNQDVNEPSVQSLALDTDTQEEWKGAGYGNNERVEPTNLLRSDAN